MRNKRSTCADAGTVHCPCLLGACGDCIICSRLSGKDYCDCDWQGVCIYSEFIQNGSKPAMQRSSRRYRIQKKIWYEKDLAVMRIEVPRGFAESASLPGSCVFARAHGDPACFDMPVSVMCTDHSEGIIDIAVKGNGPKSDKLLEADRFVEMRGIYRNGLLGVKKLLSPERKRVLCLAKGVGLAPVINYCIWAGGKDFIDVRADLDKVNRFFAEDVLAGCPVNHISFGRLPIDDMEEICREYDLVMLCASDYYQENLRIPEEKKIISNNFTMCCGEGICGACICLNEDGTVKRMCKCKEK